MKLRIRDNALRLRLSVSEVACVAAGETVAGRMPLPGGEALVYRLMAGELPGATLVDTVLSVSFPPDALRDWASGDAVSLSGQCEASGNMLELLVEKDFACLSPRAGNDDDDTFAHPEAGSQHC